MQVEPGMLGEPGLHVLVVVGGVVVQNHMNRNAFGHFLVYCAQELEELFVAVLVHARADHGAIQGVECGEQRGGAVPLVVAGSRARPALGHRQRSLGAIERLDRGLLVHAQHHSLLRRVQVEPDDVDELLLEGRVVGELERLDQVRLEATPGPDPLHGGRTNADGFGHRPAAPVRCTGRLFVLSQTHDLLNLLRRDPRFAATTVPYLAELGQPFSGEPGPPRTDRDRGDANARGDLGVGHTFSGHQQHLGPLHLTMGRGRSPGQDHQRLTLTGRHDQRGCSLVHADSLPTKGYLFWRHTTSLPSAASWGDGRPTSCNTPRPGGWPEVGPRRSKPQRRQPSRLPRATTPRDPRGWPAAPCRWPPSIRWSRASARRRPRRPPRLSRGPSTPTRP